MEKQKPHHDLAAFKRSFSAADTRRVTRTALRDAQGLGLTLAGMVEVVQGMRAAHFYKSMTALHDHSAWQDVYHVPFGELVLYVKFTGDRLIGFLLLSFKER
jgi:motility quorum-sensing regulator/GCU-specific mRNA interferase toxin